MKNCPCDEPIDAEVAVDAQLNAIASGQDVVPRQVRSFPDVRESILSRIPEQAALAAWRARNDQDLGLMLVDMWAYVSDVLSFYDERIANESYLRTANLRPSLRRLVELLGYVPAPGVASRVTLAAVAEGRRAVDVPKAAQFRSDAFGDEAPQVFETTEPTVIHPFKNEWTLGPVATGTLPQKTPTELEREAALGASEEGTTETTTTNFLVFETTEFGLAVDRLVLIKVADEAAVPTRVVAIKSIAGRDGRVFAEVEFQDDIEIPANTPAREVQVLVPTVIARITSNLPFPRTTDPPGPDPIEEDRKIYLDSLYRQLRSGDDLVIQLGEDNLQSATVESLNERLVVLETDQSLSDNPKLPVTYVVLEHAIEDISNVLEEISFHFAFVSGGRVTTIGETELSPALLQGEGGVTMQGTVDRPPEVQPGGDLAQDFMVSDPDGKGAQVSGRMNFDVSGRARLFVQDGENLTEPFYRTPLSVYGNLIQATRGETVFNEVLGSGDPRVPSQQFQLKKSPLTYVPADNIQGRASTLRVFVSGVEWKEVRSFFRCREDSEVFTVRHTDDQETIITFGDGVRGARLPSGGDNVVATYRFGSGAAAPPAGAIEQVSRPVLGLRSVRSPVAAQPGKDPDGPETLRGDAPRSVLLLGRAVAPPDFQALANLQPGVIKADAEFAWLPLQQTAGVRVMYIGDAQQSTVEASLRAQAEEGLYIEVTQAWKIPVVLNLTVARDPAYQEPLMRERILDALLNDETGPLSLMQAQIGGQLLSSDVFEAIHRVPGVVSVQSIRIIAYAPGQYGTGALFRFYESFRQSEEFGLYSNLAQHSVVCVPDRSYFDLTGADAIDLHFSEALGPVTAARRGGC